MQNHDENRKQYWDGKKNKIIRLYFYTQRGLLLFNEFRYVFMLIFGLYVVLKLSNPIWFLIMFAIIIPVLIVAGWMQVHHMARVINWLDVEFASFWTRYGYELQERQNKILNQILGEVKK